MNSSPAKDRRARLLQSTSLNGIDFVEVATEDQTVLRVHFLNDVALSGTLDAAPVIDGGETIRALIPHPVGPADWGMDGGHVTLQLTVDAPGDFSNYRLKLRSVRLDRMFSESHFSFKVRCASDLDCRPATASCPPPTTDVPPIDYLAKDFLSFRQALLDFSSLRYPQWQERGEADFGVMFLEALSAVADDLSYQQDRIAAEASLENATQRRSIVRHARLVDYEPRPAIAASVVLQFDLDDANKTRIDHGTIISAPGPDGRPIFFETGPGLVDRLIDPDTGRRPAKNPFTPVRMVWNRRIQPYWFDDTDRCLPAGTTEMYVIGHDFKFTAGQALLIDTAAAVLADPPIRQIVQLIDDSSPENPTELFDPLFPLAGPPTPVTRIRWRDADRLTASRDLTRSVLAGNLVTATQGVTITDEPFAVPKSGPIDPSTPAQTVVRTGPRALASDAFDNAGLDPLPQHLYTLATAPLAWLQGIAAADLPLPEALLEQIGPDGVKRQSWTWLRQMLDAERFATAYTIDAERFRRIARNSDGSAQYEYDGDAGDTIRFGDGTFGEVPDDGTRFKVTYRVGAGAAGNVAPDSITLVDPGSAAGIASVTNPLAASGGADPETPERIRRLAPQAFRAVQYRAVRPEDYEQAAEALPWVQRAGTAFRWTGSWLTVFTTPDPLHSEQVTIEQRTELIALLNRRRMAGYESYVPEPRYVSLDVEVEVCAKPDAFRGDVKAGVLAALDASNPQGFFNPDHFSFGQPLERSRLEAVAQRVPGVAGVLCVHYRVRGRTAGLAEMPDSVAIGADQIIRCDNDYSVPEHGSLQIIVQGGK